MSTDLPERMVEGLRLISDGIAKLNSGPLEFYIKSCEEKVRALFDRFAPFKEGDRVIMIETPQIDEKTAWGWMAAKHFLVKGARGTVVGVDYFRGAFRADVVWDHQTYLFDGVERPVGNPAQYNHAERYLERLAPLPPRLLCRTRGRGTHEVRLRQRAPVPMLPGARNQVPVFAVLCLRSRETGGTGGGIESARMLHRMPSPGRPTAATHRRHQAMSDTILPDGSAFSTLSLPLPVGHWLTRPGHNEPPMPYRMGTDNPERIVWEQMLRAAGQHAVRAATMNGQEKDFDPDALIQNLIVGFIGYYTPDGRSRT